MILWRFRHDLPLAAAIGVGGRKDIPAGARERYEDAGRAARRGAPHPRASKREVERELTTGEREQLSNALGALERR
jgi:signal peptidase I